APELTRSSPPRRRWRISPPKWWQQRIVVSTLRETSSSQVSILRSRKCDPWGSVPAFPMKSPTSRDPTVETIRSNASGAARSMLAGTHSTPLSARICSASSVSSFSRRATRMHLTPFAATRRESSRPTPSEAPATIAQGPYLSAKADRSLISAEASFVRMDDDAGRALGAPRGLEGLGDVLEADDPSHARQRVEAPRADRVQGAVPVLGPGTAAEEDAHTFVRRPGAVERVARVPAPGGEDPGPHLAFDDDALDQPRSSDALVDHGRLHHGALVGQLPKHVERRALRRVDEDVRAEPGCQRAAFGLVVGHDDGLDAACGQRGHGAETDGARSDHDRDLARSDPGASHVVLADGEGVDQGHRVGRYACWHGAGHHLGDHHPLPEAALCRRVLADHAD